MLETARGAGTDAGEFDELYRDAAELAARRMVFRHRFVKFGTVGGSGVLITWEYCISARSTCSPRSNRHPCGLNVSLCLAILCATGNNFTWNRLWTGGPQAQERQTVAAPVRAIHAGLPARHPSADGVHQDAGRSCPLLAGELHRDRCSRHLQLPGQRRMDVRPEQTVPREMAMGLRRNGEPARPEGRPGREAHAPVPPAEHGCASSGSA